MFFRQSMASLSSSTPTSPLPYFHSPSSHYCRLSLQRPPGVMEPEVEQHVTSGGHACVRLLPAAIDPGPSAPPRYLSPTSKRSQTFSAVHARCHWLMGGRI